MKRTFVKHIKQSLAVMSLVLGVFLFSATSAEAQSGAGIGEALNWKSSSDAQQVLVATITNLHNDPQVSVVGSQPYIQVHYFKEIYGRINDGSSTWQASRESLNQFSDSFSTQANVSGVVLNNSQKDALFQVAVGLLTD